MGPALYPSPLKYLASLCKFAWWGLNLQPKLQILHLLPLELGLGGSAHYIFVNAKWIVISYMELNKIISYLSNRHRFTKSTFTLIFILTTTKK